MLSTRSALFAAVAACAMTLAADNAQAAPAATAAAVPFNIEAGPMDAALMAYAAQSHRQILVDRALVAGRRTPALRATLAPGAALDQLLAGSGLIVRQTGTNVFVVHLGAVAKTGLPLAAVELPTVQSDGPIAKPSEGLSLDRLMMAPA